MRTSSRRCGKLCGKQVWAMPALPNENLIFRDKKENFFILMNRLFQDENGKEK